eukprot:TRINITY_DN4931_c0_g1_i2.p1 TRINITY_DN4931_c0_g1~~TRINITY_DN4931_c0_g1_i2.p1  ORF type:complete len:3634 (+),score=1053.62 TRINITY_DN4931_c0_g1_i2:79-10902(+)
MPSSRTGRSVSIASGYSKITSKTAPSELIRDREVVATFHDSLTDLRCACYVMGRVWTSTKGGKIVIRDPRLKVVSMVNETERCGYPACIYYISNRRHVWVGYSSGVIKVYSGATSREVPEGEFKRHTSTVHSITCDHGEFAFSGSADFQIIQWRSQDFKVVRFILGHGGGVRHVQCHAGQLLSASDDTTVRVWKISTGESVKRIHAHSQSVRVLLTTQNHYVWTGGDDGVIQIYDGSTFDLIISLEEHDGAVTSLTEVDHEVWSGSNDRTICVWNYVDFRLIKRLDDHNNFITVITKVISQREVSELWTAAADKEILIWGYDAPFDSDECQRLREDLSISQTAFQEQTAALKARFGKIDLQKDQLIDDLNKTIASQAEDLLRCNDISTDLQRILVEKEEEITLALETKFDTEREELQQELESATTARLNAEKTTAELASTAAQVPHLKAALETEASANLALKEVVTKQEISMNDQKLQHAEIIAECEASLSIHEREIADFQKTSSLKDAKIKQQQQDLTEVTIQRAKLEEQYQATTMQLSESDDLLTAERGTVNILKAENDRLQATVSDYASKQKDLRAQLSSQISNVTLAQELSSRTDGRVADLERELAENTSLSDLLASENTQLKKRLAEANTSQQHLRTLLSESTSRPVSSAGLRQATDKVIDLETQLSEVQRAADERLAQVIQNNNSDELKKELELLQNQNTDLSKNKLELESSVTALENEVRQLKHQNTTLAEQLSSHDHHELQVAMKRQIQHLESALAETESERDEALKRLETVFEATTSRSLSSSPHRSRTAEWAEQPSSGSPEVQKVLIDQYEQDIQNLKTRYSSEVLKQTELQQHLDGALSQLSELKATNETTSNELRDLKKENRKLQSAEANSLRLIEDLQLAASGERSEREASLRKIKQTEQLLNDFKAENRRLTDELQSQQQSSTEDLKLAKKELLQLKASELERNTTFDTENQKQQITSLKAELQTAKATIVSCQATISAAEADSADNEKLRTELASLKDEVLEMQGLKQQLAKFQEMKSEVEELQKREQKLTAQVKETDQQLINKTDIITTLQNDLTKAKETITKLESMRADRDTEITDLKTKDQNLTTSLDSLKGTIATLEADLSAVSQKLTAEESSHQQTLNELTTSKATITNLERDGESAKSLLQEETTKQKELSQKLTDQNTKIDFLTAEVKRQTSKGATATALENEVISLRQAAVSTDEMKRKIVELEMALIQKTNTLDELTDNFNREKSSAQMELQTLRDELRDYSTCREQVQALKDSEKQLLLTRHSLEQQLVSASETQRDLERQITDCEYQIDSLKTSDQLETSSLRSKLADSERRFADLEAKHRDVEFDQKEDLQTLESLLASERQSNGGLRKKIGEMQQRLDNNTDGLSNYDLLRTELNEERDQNAILRKKNSDLQKRLTAADEELTSEKSVRSVIQNRFDELKKTSAASEQQRDSEIESLTSSLLQTQDLLSNQRKKASTLDTELQQQKQQSASLLSSLTDERDTLKLLQTKYDNLLQSTSSQESEKLIDSNKTNSLLQGRLTEAQNQLSECERQWNDLKSEHASLKDTSSGLQRKVSDITHRFDSASQELEQERDTSNTLRRKLTELQRTVAQVEDESRSEIQEVMQMLDQERANNVSLKKQLTQHEDTRNTIAELKQSLESERQLNADLKRQTNQNIPGIEDQLSTARDTISDLRKKISDLQHKLSQQESDHFSQLQQNQSELDNQKITINNLRDQLTTSKSKLQELTSQKESIAQQLATMSSDYDHLSNQNSATVDSLRDANKKIRQQQLAESSIRTQLEDAKLDSENLSSTLKLERDSLAEQKRRLSESQKANSKLHEELQAARQNNLLDNRPIEVEELQHNADTLQNYLNLERQTVVTLRKKISDLVEQNRCNEEAASRVQELENDIEQLRESHSSEVRDLKSKNRQIKAQEELLSSRLLDAADDLENEKQQHEREVARLRQRIERTTTKQPDDTLFDVSNLTEDDQQNVSSRERESLSEIWNQLQIKTEEVNKLTNEASRVPELEQKLQLAAEEIGELKLELQAMSPVRDSQTDLRSEVDDLNKQLSEAVTKASRVSELEDKLRLAEEQIEKLNTVEKIETGSSEAEPSSKNTTNHQNQLSEAMAEASRVPELEDRLRLATEEAIGHQKEVDDLNKQLNEATAKASRVPELEEKLRLAVEQIDEFNENAKTASSNDDIPTKQPTTTSEKDDNNHQNKQLEILKAELAQSVEKETASNKELNEIRESLQLKTEEVNKLTNEASRVPELEQKLQLAAEEIGELKIELQTVTPVRDSQSDLLNENTDLRHQIESLQNSNDELQRTTTALRDLEAAASESNKTTAAELQQATQQIADLEAELEQRTNRRSTDTQQEGSQQLLEEEIANHKAELKQTSQQIVKLSSELQAALEEINNLKMNNNDHAASINELLESIRSSTVSSDIAKRVSKITSSQPNESMISELKELCSELEGQPSLFDQLTHLNNHLTTLTQSSHLSAQLSKLNSLVSELRDDQKNDLTPLKDMIASLTNTNTNTNTSVNNGTNVQGVHNAEFDVAGQLEILKEMIQKLGSNPEQERQLSSLLERIGDNDRYEKRINDLEQELSRQRKPSTAQSLESVDVAGQLDVLKEMILKLNTNPDQEREHQQQQQQQELLHVQQNLSLLVEKLNHSDGDKKQPAPHTTKADTKKDHQPDIATKFDEVRDHLSSQGGDVSLAVIESFDALKAAFNDIQHEYESLLHDNTTLRTHLSESTHDQEFLNKYEDSQLRIADLEALDGRSRDQINDLESQLTEVRQELQEHVSELNRLHDLLESSNATCELKDQQLQKQIEIVEEINSDHSTLVNEVTRLQQQLEKQSNIAAQNSALSKEFRASEHEGGLLRDRIRQLEDELEEAKQTAEDYRAIAKEITRKIEPTGEEEDEEVEEPQRQQQQQHQGQEQEQDTTSDLHDQLRSLRKANLFLVLDKTKLVDSFADAEEQVATLKERAQLLKDTIQTLNEESDKKTTEIAEWKDKCESIQGELSAVMETTLNQTSDKDAEIINLSNTISQLTSRYEEQVEVTALLRRKINNENNNEIHELQTANATLQNDLHTLKDQLNIKDQEVHTLKNKLQSLMADDKLEEARQQLRTSELKLCEQDDEINQLKKQLAAKDDEIITIQSKMSSQSVTTDVDGEIHNQLRLITKDHQEQLEANEMLRRQLASLQNEEIDAVLENYEIQVKANSDLRDQLKKITEAPTQALPLRMQRLIEENAQLREKLASEGNETPGTPSYQNTAHWESQLGEQLQQVTEDFQEQIRVNSTLRRRIDELEDRHSHIESDEEETTIKQLASILNVKAQELQASAGRVQNANFERDNVQQEFDKVEQILRSQGFTSEQEHQLLLDLRKTFDASSMILNEKTDELQRDLQKIQHAYSTLASPQESPIHQSNHVEDTSNISVDIPTPVNLHIESVALKCVIQLIANQLKTQEVKYRKLKERYGNKVSSQQLVPTQVIADVTELLGRIQYVKQMVSVALPESSLFSDVESLEEFCSEVLVRYSCDPRALTTVPAPGSVQDSTHNNSSVYECPAAGRVSPRPPEMEATFQTARPTPPPSLMGLLRNA